MAAYHKYLKDWTNERGITSYLGSDKKAFQRDWLQEKREKVRFGERNEREVSGMGGEDINRAGEAFKKPESMGGEDINRAGEPFKKPKLSAAKKSKGRLKASQVEEFVSRLPEGLEKYTASFLLETDPLKEFDDKEGLYALWYCLDLLQSAEVGKVKYGVDFTKSQKYAVILREWSNAITKAGNVGVALTPERVIDAMPKVQTAVNVLFAKYPEWRVEVYYGGAAMGSSKSIRCKVSWTGKKGRRGQDELWKAFTTAVIRPLLMDTARWNKALKRVGERREGVVAERGVAFAAKIAETTRVGDKEVQTDLTTKQVIGAVKKVLDDNKITLSGYTKWKDVPNENVGYIIGRMKEIFDRINKDGKDYRPIWKQFKKIVEIK